MQIILSKCVNDAPMGPVSVSLLTSNLEKLFPFHFSHPLSFQSSEVAKPLDLDVAAVVAVARQTFPYQTLMAFVPVYLNF